MATPATPVIPTTATPPESANLLRKMAPAFTETYVAYGVCEALVKECARVADYEMPAREGKEEKEKDQKKMEMKTGKEEKNEEDKIETEEVDQNGRVLKTKDGEELGVGKGWWFEGTWKAESGPSLDSSGAALMASNANSRLNS